MLSLVSKLLFAGLLTTLVKAHFQLQFPDPRGIFVEDQEVNFCDGYTNAVDNRTVFPLSGGFITLNSEHPKWTFGILISTDQDPTQFGNFNHTSSGQALPMVQNFFSATGEGTACVSVNISSLGISGVQSGSNVSLEFVFDGGDGQLYQCADLTLSDTATVPFDVQCTHAVGPNATSTTTSSPSGSSTSTSTTSSSSTTNTNGPNAAVTLERMSGTSITVVGLIAAVAMQIL